MNLILKLCPHDRSHLKLGDRQKSVYNVLYHLNVTSNKDPCVSVYVYIYVYSCLRHITGRTSLYLLLYQVNRRLTASLLYKDKRRVLILVKVSPSPLLGHGRPRCTGDVCLPTEELHTGEWAASLPRSFGIRFSQ